MTHHTHLDSFSSRTELALGDDRYTIWQLAKVPGADTLPYSLKILVENLLRTEDGQATTAHDIAALGQWDPAATPATEIQFRPARVLMQDFTGVPAVVDLAAMREAMASLGGDATKINPLIPAEMVIDHSVIADAYGSPDALARNVDLEYQRNLERYQFLRWGQTAFSQFRVVPPGMGIVHQVNIEHLARVVFASDATAYPDTVIGTDSHTTMVNGLGVLGWGVGGIEAEAAMLGQPVSMLIPKVLGVKLTGELPATATATDLVLTITELLRGVGVVGSFVEFYGPGVSGVSLANRATIGNMSPEYGSTCAIFPIDAETVRYLRLTGRSDKQCALVEAYCKAQGLWHDSAATPRYSQTVELDLATVEPSLAGPRRPQDRVALSAAKARFRQALPDYVTTPAAAEVPGVAVVDPGLPDAVAGPVDEAVLASFPASDPVALEAPDSDEQGSPAPAPADEAASYRPRQQVEVALPDGSNATLDHGHVVIAAITSCTNTSNPSVMLAAGLLARKAVEKGLTSKPWVKTTLAPGSQVVRDYLERAGVTQDLQKLGFYLVGFGCTTCIGNSGPLAEPISAAINEHDLTVAAVLSGNRNFEGRINPDVKMNYLASPPLVVAYALAGTMDIDLDTEPLGHTPEGTPVYLREVWPTPHEVEQVVAEAITPEMFAADYANVFAGDQRWQQLPTPAGDTFAWETDSTYVRRPPYFDQLATHPAPVTDIADARVLLKLGDSVTTDHISPAGSIKPDSPAGRYLAELGVARGDFNSYGSRRGNHEVMIRGTFANIRLRNQLVPGVQGGVTRNWLTGEQTSVYEAAMAYQQAGVPTVVLAGVEYGSGSSRDWAAKGTALLGVKAVIAQSYERIHRSNLIGMGVLPLEYLPGESADSLGLTGEETFRITGLEPLNHGQIPAQVSVQADDRQFQARVRIDTPGEASYFRHGGIMPFVVRELAAAH